jgi:hypothetical protein
VPPLPNSRWSIDRQVHLIVTPRAGHLERSYQRSSTVCSHNQAITVGEAQIRTTIHTMHKKHFTTTLHVQWGDTEIGTLCIFLIKFYIVHVKCQKLGKFLSKIHTKLKHALKRHSSSYETPVTKSTNFRGDTMNSKYGNFKVLTCMYANYTHTHTNIYIYIYIIS